MAAEIPSISPDVLIIVSLNPPKCCLSLESLILKSVGRPFAWALPHWTNETEKLLSWLAGKSTCCGWPDSTLLSPVYINKQVFHTFLKKIKCNFINQGEQGWHSGESARLPPMCPGFDSRTRRHMWVEFVVGSLLCSERFFSGYSSFPSPQKPTLNFDPIWSWNA